MWILSQDGNSMMSVESLHVVPVYHEATISGYSIKTFEGDKFLAKYSTKEDAQNVLKDIYHNMREDKSVYKMPQED